MQLPLPGLCSTQNGKNAEVIDNGGIQSVVLASLRWLNTATLFIFLLHRRRNYTASASYSPADLLLQSKRSYHHNTQTSNIDVILSASTQHWGYYRWHTWVMFLSNNFRPHVTHVLYVLVCLSECLNCYLCWKWSFHYDMLCLFFSAHRPLYSSDGRLHRSVCFRRDDL